MERTKSLSDLLFLSLWKGPHDCWRMMTSHDDWSLLLDDQEDLVPRMQVPVLVWTMVAMMTMSSPLVPL